MRIRSENSMRRLSREHVSLVANRAHALAEPTRVRMIETLSRGDQAVGQLATALGMQQSTASKHLQVLYRAGLVERRRVASAVIYSVAAPKLLEWCRYLGHRQHATAADSGRKIPRMKSTRRDAQFRAARRSGTQY
ncbi:MAG: ArsR/SmtB family transcription factor [Vicinamibacterales bacterium]